MPHIGQEADDMTMTKRKTKKYLAARIICSLVFGAYLVGGHRSPVAWGSGMSGDATIDGTQNYVDGPETAAWGSTTEAHKQAATAFGSETIANGFAATAWGYNSNADKNTATAWGDIFILYRISGKAARLAG